MHASTNGKPVRPSATTRKYRCDAVQPVYGSDGAPTGTFQSQS